MAFTDNGGSSDPVVNAHAAVLAGILPVRLTFDAAEQSAGVRPRRRGDPLARPSGADGAYIPAGSEGDGEPPLFVLADKPFDSEADDGSGGTDPESPPSFHAFPAAIIGGTRFEDATPGGKVYLDPAGPGLYTQTAPTNEGELSNVIGFALDTTTLLLFPSFCGPPTEVPGA